MSFLPSGVSGRNRSSRPSASQASGSPAGPCRMIKTFMPHSSASAYLASPAPKRKRTYAENERSPGPSRAPLLLRIGGLPAHCAAFLLILVFVGQRGRCRLQIAGEVPFPPQGCDESFGLFHLEAKCTGRLHRVVHHGLLRRERLDGGTDTEGERLRPSQALLRPLQLTLAGLEPLESLLRRLELLLRGQQHRAGLLDLAPGRPDVLDVFHRTLGQIEHVLDLGLDRLDTSLPGEGLLQGLGCLGLGRLPLSEELLEVRDLPVDCLERAGTGLELAGETLEAPGLVLRLAQGGADSTGYNLHPLGGLGRLLPQLGGAAQMLRRLVQRSLPLLQLLAQKADALFQLIDLVGA